MVGQIGIDFLYLKKLGRCTEGRVFNFGECKQVNIDGALMWGKRDEEGTKKADRCQSWRILNIILKGLDFILHMQKEILTILSIKVYMLGSFHLYDDYLGSQVREMRT